MNCANESVAAVIGVLSDDHRVHMRRRVVAVVVVDRVDVCRADMADKGHAQRHPSLVADHLWQGPYLLVVEEASTQTRAQGYRHDAQIYNGRPMYICC